MRFLRWTWERAATVVLLCWTALCVVWAIGAASGSDAPGLAVVSGRARLAVRRVRRVMVVHLIVGRVNRR
jgi:hypothetical protein